MGPADSKPRAESLYFRGSPKLREDAEKFGVERGLTLSSALAVLVERGLEAVGEEESVRALEQCAQQLQQEVAVLRERDNNWNTIFNSLKGQLQALRVGKCPGCQTYVTAFDHLLARRCPACGQPMDQVLVEHADEFPPALAGLVGALGGLLFGLAASSQSGLKGPV